MRYNFVLPKALHKRFKLACVEMETTMSAVLAHLIRGWLADPVPPTEEQPADVDRPDEDEAAARLRDVLDKASARK